MVFEDRVLRRIFVPESDEIIGDWKKLHSEEFYNLYDLPRVIKFIKPRRMK
jgi:hypothetical protein